jgi:hypothetical protein
MKGLTTHNIGVVFMAWRGGTVRERERERESKCVCEREREREK